MASLGTTNMSALIEIAQGGPEGFAKLSLVKYATVISCTIVFLELFAKMEEEVAYIWPSPWTFTKVLYMINRYSPVIDIVMGVASTHSTTLTQKKCATEYRILGVVYAIGSYSSEFILIIRTLALYNFSTWIIASMCVLVIVLVVPSTVLSGNFLVHGPYPPSDIIRITGCMPSVDDFEVFVVFACIIASETDIGIQAPNTVAQLKSIIPPRNGSFRSPIVRTMYRDGSYFYIFLLIVSVANLCVTMLESPAGRSILQMPVRAIHSALCTRVLLNLRAAAAQTSELPTTTFVKVTALAFEDPYSYTRRDVALEMETNNVDEDSRTRARVQEQEQ